MTEGMGVEVGILRYVQLTGIIDAEYAVGLAEDIPDARRLPGSDPHAAGDVLDIEQALPVLLDEESNKPIQQRNPLECVQRLSIQRMLDVIPVRDLKRLACFYYTCIRHRLPTFD